MEFSEKITRLQRVPGLDLTLDTFKLEKKHHRFHKIEFYCPENVLCDKNKDTIKQKNFESN